MIGKRVYAQSLFDVKIFEFNQPNKTKKKIEKYL